MVRYFKEDTKFEFKHRLLNNRWLKMVAESEIRRLGDINSGDLFISVDSVRENSVYYGTEFEDELNRVIVHGLLHLIGYDDHSEDDIKVMREKENYYLDLRKKLV